MGSALMGSLQILCFLTEGPFGYSSEPIFHLPKTARAYLIFIAFAAAPLASTPFVRNQTSGDPQVARRGLRLGGGRRRAGAAPGGLLRTPRVRCGGGAREKGVGLRFFAWSQGGPETGVPDARATDS